MNNRAAFSPPARYPGTPSARNEWVLKHRVRRPPLDPSRPYASFVEDELSCNGEMVSVATVFLTNRECPWRCVMCDLWKNTLSESVPPGAIPAQIDFALAELESRHRTQCRERPLRQIKLYNSGSFFDPGAIPPADYPAIAECVAEFERVIVECHPALIGERVAAFRELLPANSQLEVAMGLETAHADVLEQLNKRMKLEDFARAATFLRENEVALRAFVLVKPPFMHRAEAVPWAVRSIEFAFDCGATAVSLIPTRFGNGALEALAQQGQFEPPSIAMLEAALTEGLRLGRGRVFADLWDLEVFSECEVCFSARLARLREANSTQRFAERVPCSVCGN